MGCLRALFVRIGCLAVLVVGGFLAFVYREQVTDIYRRMRGLPPRAEADWIAPVAAGSADVTARLARLGQPDGPAYVDLTAGDIAALLDAELAREGRRVMDSVQVALFDDELRLRASFEVSAVPGSTLGPLAGMIGPRETVQIGGTLSADSTGRLLFQVNAIQVRDFPFPRSMIPALLRQLRIPGLDGGSIPIPGVGAVGDARVTSRRVRLYRMER